jgi:hypothetical protein
VAVAGPLATGRKAINTFLPAACVEFDTPDYKVTRSRFICSWL